MLEGLCALLDRGSIPHGGENTKSVHETFSIHNDPVGSFVANHCRLAAHEQIRKEELISEYRGFLADNGLPEALDVTFFKNLKARFPQLKEKRAGTNERVRYICGICVTEE